VYAVAGLGDIGEQVGKELIPVFQELDLISLIETGLGQSHHGWDERGQIAGLPDLKLRLAASLGGSEHDGSSRHGDQRGNERDHRNAHVVRAALALLDPFAFHSQPRFQNSSAITG
jgi:hypothetical protein